MTKAEAKIKIKKYNSLVGSYFKHKKGLEKLYILDRIEIGVVEEQDYQVFCSCMPLNSLAPLTLTEEIDSFLENFTPFYAINNL